MENIIKFGDSKDEQQDLSERDKKSCYLSLLNEKNSRESQKANCKENTPTTKRISVKKRQDMYGVQEEEDIIHEKIQIDKNKKMNPEDSKHVIRALSSHFFFSNLTSEELEKMTEKMFYGSVEMGEYVFKQNDRGSCFFFIAKGSVDVLIDGVKKKSLGVNQTFGELAQLYDSPRSASIHCPEICYFWAIDRITFKRVYQDVAQKQFKENRDFLDTVILFANMSDPQKDSITSSIITQKFEDGQNQVNKGDQADSQFIIKEGITECILEDGKVVREINVGETFGEAALYEDTKRSQTVRAKGDVKCIAIARITLQNIFGDKIIENVGNNNLRWALNNDKIFSGLTKIQAEKWVQASSVMKLKQGDILHKKNGLFDSIIIVIEGTVHDQTNDKDYGPKSIVGLEYCYPKIQIRKKSKFNSVMKTDGKVSRISLENLQLILGENVESILKNNERSHEKRMGKVDLSFRNEVAGLTLKELVYIKKLGEGQFGEVYLTFSQKNKTFYALKVISRKKINKFSLERHTLQEKKVLELINFPLIIKLFRTFADKRCIYFLLSYIQGIELFDAIRQQDFLNNSDASFYIGSMIQSIEFQHSHQIVYRDIKPENIMVNETGQLILIDMGTAKKIGSSKDTCGPCGRTNTILGTPHYMAPEILQGKGYGLNVDLWSIGVCQYEFMIGMVPFGDDCEEPYDVYQQIVSNKQAFPGYFITDQNKIAARMMQQLMKRSPEARHGGSYAAQKAHPWFDNLDWDLLVEMKVKAPYLPPKSSVINMTIVEKQIEQGVNISDEIKKNTPKSQKNNDDRKPTIVNWDQEF